MTEPTNHEPGQIHIDLSKYIKTPTEKSESGGKHHHYVTFESGPGKTPDEIRAYEIVDTLMKKNRMTAKQIAELFYEYVLDPIGIDMGI